MENAARTNMPARGLGERLGFLPGEGGSMKAVILFGHDEAAGTVPSMPEPYPGERKGSIRTLAENIWIS